MPAESLDPEAEKTVRDEPTKPRGKGATRRRSAKTGGALGGHPASTRPDTIVYAVLATKPWLGRVIDQVVSALSDPIVGSSSYLPRLHSIWKDERKARELVERYNSNRTGWWAFAELWYVREEWLQTETDEELNARVEREKHENGRRSERGEQPLDIEWRGPDDHSIQLLYWLLDH